VTTREVSQMPIQEHELTPDQLRAKFDPAALDFETTAQLQRELGSLGQERAIAAIDFGCGMAQPGYNIYASGPTGTGRNPTALARVQEAASRRSTPDDWCYVFNFEDARRPNALRLPSGQGPEFAKAVEEIVSAIRTDLPRSFESEEYEQRKEQETAQVQGERNRILRELEQEARTQGMMLQPTPMGVVTVPLVEGKPMSREQFEQLPEDERHKIEERMEQFRARIGDALTQVRQLEKEARRLVEQLDRQQATAVIADRFDELKGKFEKHEEVVQYLDALAEDIVAHQEEFRAEIQQQEEGKRPEGVPGRYRVNVLVHNQDRGAPVIQENSPTYYNLFGRLEYQPVAGGAVTDFTLIKSGAMHRANGGFLIVQAIDLLTSPFAWEAMKRTMRGRQLTIENIGEQYYPIPAAGLRPEPVPLDVKVVMVGSPWVYFLLYYYDEEFRKLFKVRADFDIDMPSSPGAAQAFADFVHTYVERHDLRPLDREAVGRVLEYAKRLASDKERLSTHISSLIDVLAEASHWAGQTSSEVVTREHVDRALEQQEYRSRMFEDRMFEYIERGDLRIETAGAVVGQVNGLAVMDIGGYMFGRPSRITCQATPGRSGVVNVDREARLAGDIHSKAVLILSGYIAGTYAAKAPLSLFASLSFEQSYSMVEGDSASVAELCVILSAVSRVPIRQEVAVTGSIDQYGNVQPIGGVNQKIEGFYTACKLKGLTGEQGVMVPAQNVKNLMLKPEVVEAVSEGRFHVWAVSHVDQAVEVLTGVPAGDVNQPDSIHGKVAARLQEFSEALKEVRGGERTVIGMAPSAGPPAPTPPPPPVPPTRPG
jgi:lon-related putative ATP-dependent protease